MRFSKTTGCFYPEAITYQSLPADLIVVNQADFDAAIARPSGATLDVQNGAFVIVHAPTPTPAQLLLQAQQTQVALLQASYKNAINTPVTFKNAAGVTSTYASGDMVAINGKTATVNLNNCIVSGAAAWKIGKWLDTNNIAQTFTYADLQGLAGAMEAVAVLDWQDLIMKIAEVQAATTVSAVQAIVF